MLHHVLWTGGWDSTFRMLQLCRELQPGDVVQPVYVADESRSSTQKEIETMQEITSLLRDITTPDTVKDVIVVQKADIPPNPDITRAYQAIREIVSIGKQYEWLARLATVYPGIEIGIEKPNGEYSGCVSAIEKTGKMIRRDGSFFVDPAASSRDCVLLFGNFSFPIIEMTEKEMVDLVKRWNCQFIMQKIWFCHHPIGQTACGYCRPCQQKMECDMEWLLPPAGQKRYKLYKRISKVFGAKLAKISMNLLYRR
ncbi:MAG: hypothetical protein IJ662_05650 [Clostridia bacterium]|nr:hypothetical protein [Clostridia bacterium]